MFSSLSSSFTPCCALKSAHFFHPPLSSAPHPVSRFDSFAPLSIRSGASRVVCGDLGIPAARGKLEKLSLLTFFDI